jgi:FkbH-like protein
MFVVSARGSKENKRREIKCLVWDLDNTLWEGVLLEDEQVVLKDNIIDIIKTLDKSGILQSVASRNDFDLAMGKLGEFALDNYFLYPQINWNSKSSCVKRISELINISVDTIAFIDDDAFEREEVRSSLPEVLCIDASDTDRLLDLPEFNPLFITADSENRRLMYLRDIERKKVEERFVGPKEEFLASLDMVFRISEAQEGDLKRAEELTIRTNQLNTTGYTYSYDELNHFRLSPEHKLLIAELEDKYGTYGKIGLALIELDESTWTIKLLLMSCRVMSRGVGTIMINHIRNEAKRNGVHLRAEMFPNDRNRMMYMTFKFTHFLEKDKIGNLIIFQNDLDKIQDFPRYIKVRIR